MYWCKRRIEVTVVGPEGIRVFDVDRPFLQIGSLPKSDIVVSGTGLPCRAYYLHATDQGLFCLRLAKECNGVELFQGWVGGDPLVLGDYQITARIAPPLEGMVTQGPSLDTRDGCRPPYPVIAIEIAGARISAVCIRRSLLLVGRMRPSMLRLVSDSVSSTHLVFFWDHDRFWFVDLRSSNGTEVEGQRHEVGWLEPGGVAAVGKIQLRFLGVSARRGEEYLTVEEFAQRRLRKQAEEYSRRLTRLEKKSQRRLKGKRKAWRSRYLSMKQQVDELTTALGQTRSAIELERLEWQEQRQSLEQQLKLAVNESASPPEAVTLVSAQQHGDYAISSSAQIALLEQRMNDLELQRQQERAQNALALAAEHMLLQTKETHWHAEKTSALEEHERVSTRPLVVKSTSIGARAVPTDTEGGLIVPPSLGPTKRVRVTQSRREIDPEEEETMIRVTRRLVSIDAQRRRRLLIIWSCSLVMLLALSAIGAVLVRAYAPRVWNRCVPAALRVEVNGQRP